MVGRGGRPASVGRRRRAPCFDTAPGNFLNALQVAADQRGRVEPQAGEDLAAEDTLGVGRQALELLAVAPLGDPIEVRLGDSRLSLRRAEAARVEVQLLS